MRLFDKNLSLIQREVFSLVIKDGYSYQLCRFPAECTFKVKKKLIVRNCFIGKADVRVK